MNKIYKIFSSLVMSVLMLVACTPDDHSLGKADVSPSDLVEGIAFTITHDNDNPNIVYLTSLMDAQYTPLWNHPQGRSQDKVVTLKIPFEGTYNVQFGVETRGGLVYGDTVQFKVDDFYAEFVSDELWTLISGGVDNSKTWYLDLDADGVSRFFKGPVYFFTGNYVWDNLHTASGENYIDSETWEVDKAIIPNYGDDGDVAWYWLADWAGNSWICDAADFGTMTFDLKNGANVVVDQQAYGLGYNKGSYLLNTEDYTISFTDARPLRPDSYADISDVTWGTVRILYISEDAMQLGIIPNDPTESMNVFNYISESFLLNWQPDDSEEEPPYDGDANDDLTTSQSTTKNWIVNLEAPYNWTNLTGNFLNEWTVNANGIPVFPEWEPPYDETLLSNISITLSKGGANNGTYEIITGDGTEYTGDYTIDEKNWIDFGQDIDIISGMGGWINFTTQDGKLRIISVERSVTGTVTVMYLGRNNPDNPNEYITLALVQGGPSGESSDNGALNGTVINFDNAKLVYGDVEGD